MTSTAAVTIFVAHGGASWLQLVGDGFARAQDFSKAQIAQSLLELRPDLQQGELHDEETRPQRARRGAEERIEHQVLRPFDVELNRVDFSVALLAHQGQQGLSAHANLDRREPRR